MNRMIAPIPIRQCAPANDVPYVMRNGRWKTQQKQKNGGKYVFAKRLR